MDARTAVARSHAISVFAMSSTAPRPFLMQLTAWCRDAMTRLTKGSGCSRGNVYGSLAITRFPLPHLPGPQVRTRTKGVSPPQRGEETKPTQYGLTQGKEQPRLGETRGGAGAAAEPTKSSPAARQSRFDVTASLRAPVRSSAHQGTRGMKGGR